MKTLIFSDTHLTHRFEPKKFEYLEKLFSSVNKIVINGDFWDGLSTQFEQFTSSPWNKLFPLMKKKETVYIYGNHDFAEFSDQRVNLFSIKQTQEYYLYTNPKKLIIKHGHQHTPSIQDKFNNKKVLGVINDWYDIAENWAFKILGQRFFQKGLYRSFNRWMKQYATTQLKSGEILVCGHSHNAVFEPEKKFINSGFIRHGLAQYLIIENHKIRPVQEKY